MNPLHMTGLSLLMARTLGIPDVVIGLIDGPVAEDHPDLFRENLRRIPTVTSQCKDMDSMACRHGTFIAGILNAKRSSALPGICPGCTLLVRPVFSETETGGGLPRAYPVEIASAIVECVDAGTRLLNLSVALEEQSREADRKLKEALDYAERKKVIVSAAAGNQGLIGGSALTRHPWVIPVDACDLQGRVTVYSNLAGTIARKGVCAPGEKIASVGRNGQRVRISGTSTATAFVTGAIALLWSEAPRANAEQIKSAVISASTGRRRRTVPPLLNAWEAYQALRGNDFTGRMRRLRRRGARNSEKERQRQKTVSHK